MKQRDILWLAGLLEGEGCFNYRVARKQARITIEMTDRDVIDRVANLFSTNVSVRAPRPLNPCRFCHGPCIYGDEGNLSQESYQTAIHGQRAENLMRLVFPFMGRRRAAKIEEIVGELV